MTAYQRMYYYLDHAIGEALRTAVTPPQERLSGHRRRPDRKRQQETAGSSLRSACSDSLQGQTMRGRGVSPRCLWGFQRGILFNQENTPFDKRRASCGKPRRRRRQKL